MSVADQQVIIYTRYLVYTTAFWQGGKERHFLRGMGEEVEHVQAVAREI